MRKIFKASLKVCTYYVAVGDSISASVYFLVGKRSCIQYMYIHSFRHRNVLYNIFALWHTGSCARRSLHLHGCTTKRILSEWRSHDGCRVRDPTNEKNSARDLDTGKSRTTSPTHTQVTIEMRDHGLGGRGRHQATVPAISIATRRRS